MESLLGLIGVFEEFFMDLFVNLVEARYWRVGFIFIFIFDLLEVILIFNACSIMGVDFIKVTFMQLFMVWFPIFNHFKDFK